MLKKIDSIKSLGLVFSDYSWDNETPNFKDFNIVYGWNGSGKTTFSRLFDIIDGKTQSEVSYKIIDKDDQTYCQSDDYPIDIRVFNEDFVTRNIDVRASKTNAITILLGEDNKEAIQKIADFRKILQGNSQDQEPGLIAQAKSLDTELARAKKAVDDKFTAVARIISATRGTSGLASRSYRRGEARTDFEQLSAPKTLSVDELKGHTSNLLQEVRDKIQEPNFILHFGAEECSFLYWTSRISENMQELVAATTSSQLIENLSKNRKLSDWVEAGFAIHDDQKHTNCEFCGNDISSDRLAVLAAHFDEQDRALKLKIDDYTDQLVTAKRSLMEFTLPDQNLLYTDIRDEYILARSEFSDAASNTLSEFKDYIQLLGEKRANTTEKMEFSVIFDLENLSLALKKANSFIERHNEKTKNFSVVQKASEAAITDHHLSEVYTEIEDAKSKIVTDGEEHDALLVEISTLEENIVELTSQISSSHKAAELLSAKLHAFLGRKELTFEAQSGTDETKATGYELLRNGHPAQLLSEGEKTAIGFVFFIVHLEDGHFDKNNGIVVVDDPVSSLDAGSLYQAFAFLKGSIRDCKQVFILTHNFEFLRLVINWTAYFKKRRSLYMIKNTVKDGDRCAELQELDPALRDYETEYQYLFKTLRDLKEAQDGTITLAYPVPNIARKLWETFLSFRIPNAKTPHRKNEFLKSQGLDAQKLDAIYKFTNDQSHMTGGGLNPSLVPETQKVIEYIFELMELAAPDHFKILVESTNS